MCIGKPDLPARETLSCDMVHNRFSSGPSRGFGTTASVQSGCAAAMRLLLVGELNNHPCRKCLGLVCPAIRTVVSKVSLQRSRMTAIPSAPQRPGSAQHPRGAGYRRHGGATGHPGAPRGLASGHAHHDRDDIGKPSKIVFDQALCQRPASGCGSGHGFHVR